MKICLMARNYIGTDELMEGVQLYHAKQFPIPKIHEKPIKTEVNRFVNIGVLKR